MLMGINNKISHGYAYYLTLTIEEWIDVFSRPVYKHIIVDSLNYCIANKGLEVYCWCLMSNHLHLIACATEDENLSDILRDFKKFTSKALIEAIKEIPESRRDWMLNLFWYAGKNNKKIKYFKVWQGGNDAQEIHTVLVLIWYMWITDPRLRGVNCKSTPATREANWACADLQSAL